MCYYHSLSCYSNNPICCQLERVLVGLSILTSLLQGVPCFRLVLCFLCPALAALLPHGRKQLQESRICALHVHATILPISRAFQCILMSTCFYSCAKLCQVLFLNLNKAFPEKKKEKKCRGGARH